MSLVDRVITSHTRWLFGVLFLVCAGLLAFALYLQHVETIDPCPMCILQRYAFVAVAAVALIGAVHGPRARGVMTYSGVIFLFSVVGGGISVRHAWLQHFPPLSLSCGTDLWYLLDSFPLARALPAIFQGTGECSKVQWHMLGLSIPEWALVWFAVFAISAVVVFVRVWKVVRMQGQQTQTA